jgi:hypothetical protein
MLAGANTIGVSAVCASSRTDVAQADGWAGIDAPKKSCPGDAEVIDEATKGDGPAGEGGTNENGTSGRVEGVVNWREEVLTFFVDVVFSSISLRLLPGWSTPSSDIMATVERDRILIVYDSCD